MAIANVEFFSLCTLGDMETQISLTFLIEALARNDLKGTKIEIAWISRSARVRLMFAEAPQRNVM